MSEETTNSNKNTLLIVGNPADMHSFAVILDALLLLKNTGLRLKLQCIGQVDKVVRETLDNSASYSQIKDQVEFSDDQTFAGNYKNTDNWFAGLALPITDDRNTEINGAAIFEYMAAGLPIICADLASNRELIEQCHCGICVDTNSAEEVADAISYLNRATYQANKMGESGKKAISENVSSWPAASHFLEENKKIVL